MIQELFDKAYHGILNQGGFGVADFEDKDWRSCVLKTYDGKKCAWGHCLTEDQLNTAIKKGFSLVAGGHSFWLSLGFTNEECDFGEELQKIHDLYALRNDLFGWKKKMHKLADKHNLQVSERRQS